MKQIGKLGLIGTLVLFLAINVLATDSRKMVLTGTVYHELTPVGMVITSVDSLLNPAFMLDNPSFVNVDFDSSTLTYSGYAIFKLEALNLPGMFGLQIGKHYGSYRTDIWAGPGQDINDLNGLAAPLCGQDAVGVDGINVTNLNEMRSFGLYYALPIGDKLKAGFGLSYVGRGVSGNRINDPQSVSTERDDTFKKKISVMMFRIGAVYTMMKDKLNLNADIGFGKPKYEYEYTIAAGSTADSETASFSGNDMDANLRASYVLGEKTDVVANLFYLSYGGSLEIDPDTATADDGTTYGRSQKGLVFLVGPLFHGDGYNLGIQLGFARGKSKEETTIETAATDTQKNNPKVTASPILRVFAEKRLFSWFTMRASVTFETSREKTVTNLDTDTATEDWTTVTAQPASSLTTAFGFTIDMKNGFYIDAYMYDRIFREGPWIVTGNASIPDLNAGVSIGIRL
ncbi:MAG: hypothetical protein OEY25_01345 [Candidatus Aminicenantes bacterium]|nr:hypothetical protein [Candidatus Aminicenantes bacterium]MDH5704980.1 hypothetical protein [Candidatus Aminicenantes bacterium]